MTQDNANILALDSSLIFLASGTVWKYISIYHKLSSLHCDFFCSTSQTKLHVGKAEKTEEEMPWLRQRWEGRRAINTRIWSLCIIKALRRTSKIYPMLQIIKNVSRVSWQKKSEERTELCTQIYKVKMEIMHVWVKIHVKGHPKN